MASGFYGAMSGGTSDLLQEVEVEHNIETRFRKGRKLSRLACCQVIVKDFSLANR